MSRSIILDVHPEVQGSSGKILETDKSCQLQKKRSNEDAPRAAEDREVEVQLNSEARDPEPAVEEFDDSMYEELALLGFQRPESEVERQMMSLWYQLAFTPNTSSSLQQLSEFQAPYELFNKYHIQSEAMRYWANEDLQPEISVLCHRIEIMKPKKKHCRNLKKQWQKMVEDGDDDSFGPSDASDTSGIF